MLSLPLLLLLLRGVVASDGPIDGRIFLQALEDLASKSLGVEEIQAHLNNARKEAPVEAKSDVILREIIDAMRRKFHQMNEAVEEIRNKVQEVFNRGQTFTRKDVHFDQYEICCTFSDLKPDSNFPNLTVNTGDMCAVGPASDLTLTETKYPVKDTILEAMQNNLENIPELKWQYIALEQNYVINYPAKEICWSDYQPRQRPWYKETASTVLKDVVIVFDKSRSMQSYLQQAKTAVKAVLHTLGPNDRVGIVAFDEDPSTPSSAETDCYHTKLARVVPENLKALERFVNNVWISVGPSASESVYSKAFHTAFQYFINSPRSQPRQKVILFVSDGRPTDKDTAQESKEEILRVISQQNTLLRNEVIIQTFGIGDGEGDPDGLLKSIADQRNANLSAGEIAGGDYHPVRNVEDLRELMATFYNRPVFSTNQRSTPVYTVPYHDGFGFGIVITACLPIHRGGDTFEGVACVDMLMRDLISDLTAFPNLNVGYTLMLDAAGRYMYHPLLPVSSEKNDPAVYGDFSMLERSTAAKQVRDSMIRKEQNTTVITTEYAVARGTTQSTGVDHKRLRLRYQWGPIPGTGFSICVVLNQTEQYTEFAEPLQYPNRVLFHRTDLTDDPPAQCSEHGRVVYPDNTTLALTVSAFTKPGSYYNLENINTRQVRDIEKFLEQGTPNEFQIKDGVRQTVGVLYDKLEEIWYNKRFSCEYSKTRYVGTRDGVFIRFPGMRLTHHCDDTVQPWYVKAKHLPGQLVLDGPRMDMESGEMIVTLAKTLTIRNQVLGVAAVDFELIHLFHLMKENYEQCSIDDYECMIMDSNGMVILHEDFIQNPGRGRMSQQHIVNKDTYIARELYKQRVMTRNECFNCKTIKYQNFLKVDISGNSDVDGNFFTMHKVPNTNVFIIIKNKQQPTYDSCFCGFIKDESGTPQCSPEDDCECPCHAPAQYDYCENQLPPKIDVPLPCFPDAPRYPFENLVELERGAAGYLISCPVYRCSVYLSKRNCEDLPSCAWCETNASCILQDWTCEPNTVSASRVTTTTATTAVPVPIQSNPPPPDPSPSVGPGEQPPPEPPENGCRSEKDGSTDDGNINWNIITIAVVSVMFLIIAILLVFLCMRTRPKEKEQPKRKASTSNMRETILIEDTSSRGDESERGRPATPATPMADPGLQDQQPRSDSEAEQRNAQTDMLSRLMTSIEALTLVMEGRNQIPGDAQHHTYPNHNVHLHHDHDTRHNHSGSLAHEPRFQQYHYPPQAHPQHVPNHLPAHGTHPNPDLTHPHPHPHHPQQFASGYEPPSASRRPRTTPNNPPSGEQSSCSSIYDLPFDPKSNNKGKKKDPS